ncbi:MAG: helix-hairpin-helix domain-containing protein [Halapricum sp.]
MPRDVTPLVRALERATPGVQADVYELLAAWNTSIEAAMETGRGRTESVMQQYHDPVLELTIAAAMDDGIDWAFLEEVWEAYPTGGGDHVVSTITVNVTSQCVIHTRLEDSVAAIPADALEYLSAVTQMDDGATATFESAAVGWAVGHPQFDVIERTVERAMDGHDEWTLGVLEHVLVADTDAGIDLFERLARTPALASPLRYLAPIDMIDSGDQPLMPELFEPPVDLGLSVDLSDDQRDRVLSIVGDLVSPGTLRAETSRFRFDLEGVAEDTFDRERPESVPDSMLHIGSYDGDTWHLLGSVGCADGEQSRVEYVEPFFEWQYHVEHATGGSSHTLSPHQAGEIDMCRRCLDTVKEWVRLRDSYVATRERTYDGGETLKWTPLADQWEQDCDVCGKPAGASHTESTYGQTACPSCLRALAEDDPGRIDLEPSPADTPSFTELLDGPVELRALPSREVRERRAADQRREHNRSRARLPLSYTPLTDTQVQTLAEQGYDTVGDIVDSDPDPAVFEALPGSNPNLFERRYGLELTAFDGIGATLAQRLADGGYGTLPALADASVDDLTEIGGMSEAKAERILTTIRSW